MSLQGGAEKYKKNVKKQGEARKNKFKMKYEIH